MSLDRIITRFGTQGLIESADSISPAQFTYAIDAAGCSAVYDIHEGDDAQTWIRAVLGRTYDVVDVNTGRISRDTPRCHPEDASLYAVKVTRQGYGAEGARLADSKRAAPYAVQQIDPQDPDPPAVPEDQAAEFRDSELLAPIATTPRYTVYPMYEYKVDYALLPYDVLTDRNVVPQVSPWYDERGKMGVVSYCNEWDRYVTIDEKFDPAIVTATQGQLMFFTGSGDPPHGAAFAGQPRIPYPEKKIMMTWMQVPYRYVTSRNSWLRRLAMRVNQLPWRVQGYEFEPAELLYLGYEVVRRYTQCWPEPRDLNGGPNWAFIMEASGYELLCDLRLDFMWVDRTTDDWPALPNRNWIPAGHNLLPWFGPGNSSTVRRGYHYAASFDPTDPKNPEFWNPVYESHVLQLLFTDPDWLPNPVPVEA